MEALLPTVVGSLFAVSLFMMLRQNLIKVAFGLVILTNATNLLIFTSGRLTRAVPPLVSALELLPLGSTANPVSEALILTAIVIGFGLLSFTLALIFCAYATFHTLDPDQLDLSPHPVRFPE